MRDRNDLRQRQALPLIAKVRMSQVRIAEWYRHFHGEVYISFSGGKDSTVLTHLVHDMYPDVPLVFADTGLEYPEIRHFAQKMGAEFVRPKMIFSDVISQYGYPIISKEIAEAIFYARKIRGGGVKKQKDAGMICRRKKIAGLLTRNTNALILQDKERLSDLQRLTKNVDNSTESLTRQGALSREIIAGGVRRT